MSPAVALLPFITELNHPDLNLSPGDAAAIGNA